MSRILVVRPDKLGDLLVSTPLLRALAEEGNQVDLWCPPQLVDFAHRLTSVQRVRGVPFRPRLGEVVALAREMKGYDALLLLRNDSSGYAAAGFLSGIPKRVGVARKLARFLLTDNQPHLYSLGEGHVVERIFNIAAPLLVKKSWHLPLEFPVSEEALARGRSAIPPGSVVIHPGTGGSARALPPSAWQDLAKRLARRFQLCVTGGPGEEALAHEVAEKVGYPVTGLSLEELAGGLRTARLLLCGSTGVLHVAASQRTPVVMVEPTPDAAKNVARWYPWMTPYDAVVADQVCEGCGDRRCHKKGDACVTSITTESIENAFYRLLESTES